MTNIKVKMMMQRLNVKKKIINYLTLAKNLHLMFGKRKQPDLVLQP